MIVMPPEYFLELLKAKPAVQGETRTWADGYTRKKVGKKWVLVGTAPKAVQKDTDEAEKHFDYAMTTVMGDVVEDVLEDFGVTSFVELSDKIERGPSDTAHKIYKKIVDTVNASDGTRQNKQAALHLIGTALVKLRDLHAGPKARVTVTKRTKTGKVRWEPKKSDAPPPLKATAVAQAKKLMGGWSVTGELSTGHVKDMLKTGAAKKVFGTIDARKPWVMPKLAKDMEFSYKGDSLGIYVRQVRKAGTQKLRQTARVRIDIPYAYVHAFLKNHIDSERTRSNFLFRIERSQGYRNFIERSAA